MRKYIILLIFCIVSFACEDSHYQEEKIDIIDKPEKENNSFSAEKEIIPGVLKIQFDREMLDQLKDFEVTETGFIQVKDKELNNFFAKLGVYSLKRLFPENKDFIKAEKEFGLDLWYIVRCNPELQPNTKSLSEKKIKGVTYMEAQAKALLIDPFKPSELTSNNIKPTPRTYNNSKPFNDPLLDNQWHYHNEGTLPNAVAGSDINLFEAWKHETGKPNVIVAIIDEGVDIYHEDLIQNLWINPSDGTHGYNSIDDNHNPAVGAHGTHVAGTIAAVNNNGIGVSGIAGGDGSPESGIRIMSIEFLRSGYVETLVGNPEAAFKFAAENGAVITNNSWGVGIRGENGDILGHPGLDKSTQLAIDYFIKYAGCDQDGNQKPDSPMKGGVVIFAAGNDFYNYGSPVMYEPVIAVAATNQGLKKSAYSNFGEWVDISAPGGEDEYGYAGVEAGVYSTIPGNAYAYKYGTSMAAPHVTGIAALVVSKFGGQGFTNEDLKYRLLTAVKSEDINILNPNYAGMLGSGYIDALRSLDEFSSSDNTKPESPSIVKTIEGTKQVTIQMKNNADNATSWRVYYSKDNLDEKNFTSAQKIELIKSAKKGDILDMIITNLEPLKYNMALVAVSRSGKLSDPVFSSFTSREYEGLELTLEGETNITLKDGASHTFPIAVKVANDVEWTYGITHGNEVGISSRKEQNRLLITVSSKDLRPGKYTSTVTVGDNMMTNSDQFKSIVLSYEVEKSETGNTAIKEIGSFGTIYLSSTKKLDLRNYFYSEGNVIQYELISSSSNIFNIDITDYNLTIEPLKQGQGTFVIKASAGLESIDKEVKVSVNKDELVYSIYPIPVTTNLNIRFNERVNERVRISIKTLHGQEIYSETLNKIPVGGVYTVDMKGISTGTYILSVISSEERYIKEFIKN